MLEFFASDVGKVALGGIIAVASQLVMFLLNWWKDARNARLKRTKDAEHLGIRLVLVLEEFIRGCYDAAHDNRSTDHETSFVSATVDNPVIVLPVEGDYRALPTRLMYEIMSLPNRVAVLDSDMAAIGDESDPPEYYEYFNFRERAMSNLGLKTLELQSAICREYRIPPPERPEWYTPHDQIKQVIDRLDERVKENALRHEQMMAQMSTYAPPPPVPLPPDEVRQG